MNETQLLPLELIGGPYDGKKIQVHPAMNSRFFMERNRRQEWYMSYGGGKAYYLAPRKDK